MLKKIVLILSALLILVIAVGAIAAYRFYSEASNITGVSLPTTGQCSTVIQHRPELLPWHTSSSSQASISATSTQVPPTKGRLGTRPCSTAQGAPSLSGKQRINILLLGSDNDTKFDKCGLLSQTVMVVTIDPVHKTVGFFSIPRDSWVPIPGSIPGDPYTYHKMDEAMSYGEATEANSTCTNPEAAFERGVLYEEETVYENFGIHIDYYAWVGLQGFQKVIDTLHGVNINAMHPMLDDSYPADNGSGNADGTQRVYIPEGPQYMNGATALQYVRTRHSDLNGDYGRGARQEQMLVALRPKVKALGLADILTINSLLGDLQNYVKSDIGTSRALSFANFLRNINPSSIKKVVLTPPKYSYESVFYYSPSQYTDIVELKWPPVLAAVHKMFGPVSGVKKRRHHRKTAPMTSELAVKLLVRASGAGPPSPSSGPIQKATRPVNGKLYYVDNGNVWSLTAHGLKQVTHTTAIDAAYVTPNGHKLVYYRRWSQNNADVWLHDLRTGKTHEITHSKAAGGVIANDAWFVNPVISPDGKTIIYSSDRYKYPQAGTTYASYQPPTLTYNPDCNPSPGDGGIDLALYAYSTVSHTATQLTAPCLGAGGDSDPRFDPVHKNRIVYTQFYYLKSSMIASRLVELNVQTGFRRSLTPFKGRNMQGAWSSNGRRLAWLGSSDQSTTLYEAPFYGGKLHWQARRAVDSGMISEPVFSPDGKHLAYYKLVGSGFQVWEFNLKHGWPVGKPEQLLTQTDLTSSAPMVWIK